MAQIVADSTALILLAKCGLLEIICNLFEVIVPPSVVDEVASKELVKTYPDSALISGLISKGLIKVKKPGPSGFKFPLSLHRGEKDALLLALKSDNPLFATDDGKAIKAAKFLKIPFTISPRIVVNLFQLSRIQFEEAQKSLEKLGKIGRYSPEIIAEAFLSLREEKDGKTDNHKTA